MASTYLTRTPSSTGNQKTWTWSGWVKRSRNGDNDPIFCSTNGSGTTLQFIFTNVDNLFWYYYDGTNDYGYTTSAKYRDHSAWYHIVCRVDTTQATASDRVKIYVNGVQASAPQSHGDIPQNQDTTMSSTGGMAIGYNYQSTSQNFYANVAHAHFTDGYAYDASTFGETDSTSGIWKPKTAPSVTYGTNGFFLKMENSGAMGTDSSGNSNTFTVNGTLTQNVDTPSNNFATFNPLNVPTSNAPTFSNGNNTVVTANGTSAYFGATSSLGVSSGKWYTEFKVSDASANAFIGITFDPAEDARNNRYTGQSSSSWGYFDSDGNYRTNGSGTAYGDTYTTGDIIGIAMDLDNAKLYFSKNGTFQNSGDPTSGATGTGAISITSGETYFFSCGDGTASSASTIQANFGQGYFGTTAVASANADDGGLGIMEYDVPANYRVLCTKNIKDYG